MSKTMTLDELRTHCSEATAQLEGLLNDFSGANDGKTVKRAMLLAYWIKTYIKYIRKEDQFSPQSVFKLKRGSIVQVEFGYRVGRELGGRHYAAVLDADNSLYRNTVTVIPLGSVKPDQSDDQFSVILADGIFSLVYDKVAALLEDANRTAAEAEEMRKSIEAAPPENAASLRAVLRQKIAVAKTMIERAELWIEEISQMKPGSVARVDQITTVSKMRISAPLKKNHPLYGVRLSSNDLDKIDRHLLDLYFSRKE